MKKTDDFAKKRPDLVDKSTPSISRHVSPKTGHPICDHLELICSQKMNTFDDFRILCDRQLFQIAHVQFTFEILTFSKITPHFRRNFPQKNRKYIKLFNIFGSSRKWKSCSFLMKTCPTSWAPRRTVRQNHEIPFRSTFAHFLWKSWWTWSSFCWSKHSLFWKYRNLLRSIVKAAFQKISQNSNICQNLWMIQFCKKSLKNNENLPDLSNKMIVFGGGEFLKCPASG